MPILNMMDNTGASIRRALAISQMLSLSASQLSQDELAEGLAELRAKLLEVDQANEAAYLVAAQETQTPGQAPAQIHLVASKPR